LEVAPSAIAGEMQGAAQLGCVDVEFFASAAQLGPLPAQFGDAGERGGEVLRPAVVPSGQGIV
jgi:hypothetical protein